MKKLNEIILILIMCLSISQSSLFAHDFNNDQNKLKINSQPSKYPISFIHYQYATIKRLKSSETLNTNIHKSPWFALGLAFAFPGMGQLYNGEYGKLGIIYSVALLGIGISAGTLYFDSFRDTGPEPKYVAPLIVLGLGLIGGAYIYSIIDAPISASRINTENDGITIVNTNLAKNTMKVNIGGGIVDKKIAMGLSLNISLNN